MKRCIVGVYVCLFLAMSFYVAAEPVAYIATFAGKVEIRKENLSTWQEAREKFPLNLFDKVKTGNYSWVKISYKDRATFRLRENTLIEIQDTGFRMLVGSSWIRVEKKGTKFVVNTPSLIAGVRGTFFTVSVSLKGDTSLEVKEGIVAIKTAKKEYTLYPGDKIKAFANGTDVLKKRLSFVPPLKHLLRSIKKPAIKKETTKSAPSSMQKSSTQEETLQSAYNKYQDAAITYLKVKTKVNVLESELKAAREKYLKAREIYFNLLRTKQ